MPRPVETDLTDRQKEILNAVAILGDGGAVLIGDLVQQLGVARHTSLTPTLERMESRGFLSIEGGGAKGKPRLLSLTPLGKVETGLDKPHSDQGVPRVAIASAGATGGYVLEEQAIVHCSEHPQGDRFRYVTVSGDSMDCEGVLDGDDVHVELNPEPGNGQIVVAQIFRDGTCESLLKYFYRNPTTGHIALVPHSSNPAHQVCLLAEDFDGDDFNWLRRVASGKCPVARKADVKILPVDEVSCELVWTGGLIRPYRPVLMRSRPR